MRESFPLTIFFFIIFPPPFPRLFSSLCLSRVPLLSRTTPSLFSFSLPLSVKSFFSPVPIDKNPLVHRSTIAVFSSAKMTSRPQMRPTSTNSSRIKRLCSNLSPRGSVQSRSRSSISHVVKAVATPNSVVELPLTAENVESVLDEIRPYLIADGGNVALHEIDGNVVRLKLQGACGSCPSSVMTMKMGIECRLMEKIPEIVAVEPIADEETGLEMNEENIEEGM
ncbi:hypothetical protein I3843_04G139400 [Carya illinoinensis]|nr:hypothetical protein I3843_04G139400 [Carya illinoinensis]